MAGTKYYKIYSYDQERHLHFCSETFRTQSQAKTYFKIKLRKQATRACIMEYKKDLNTRNWYWGYHNDEWVG